MTNQIQVAQAPQTQNYKGAKLVLSILFDLLGYASYIIPGVMEITDVIWAPVAGLILSRMYGGIVGKTAGIIEFMEELLPGIDFIPTFTITWFYVYVIKKGKTE